MGILYIYISAKMEIIKKFNDKHNVKILGTVENPLFKATDIAEILGITNIHMTIKDYTTDEKISLPIKTIGGIQNIMFLTEIGLYSVIVCSHKPLAKEFKKWVFNVIREIRLNGKYELEQKLIEKEKEINEKETKLTELEEQNKLLHEETEKIKLLDKTPVIYIYNNDTRKKDDETEIKIGCSQNYYERIKPFRASNKFGKVEHTYKIYNRDLMKFEHMIHYFFSDFKIEGEVFKIGIKEANFIILCIVLLFKFIGISDSSDRFLKLSKIVEFMQNLYDGTDSKGSDKKIKVSTHEISIQTEIDDDNLAETVPIIDNNDLFNSFEQYFKECCIVRPDVEDSTVNLTGQYRIWSKSASKETYLALNSYLKTKFKPTRLKVQDKNCVIMGFQCIKLKELEYKKIYVLPTNIPETFIFNSCVFVPSGKVLFSDLYDEYIKWKNKMTTPIKNNEEKELKKYLKECEYVLQSLVWCPNGNGLGYYGISLKSSTEVLRKTSSTGKCVEKRYIINNEVIDIYETIAKAAESEKIAPCKMSRSIKAKTTFNNDYYFAIKE
jgi:prophage antirepressor-like protein